MKIKENAKDKFIKRDFPISSKSFSLNSLVLGGIVRPIIKIAGPTQRIKDIGYISSNTIYTHQEAMNILIKGIMYVISRFFICDLLYKFININRCVPFNGTIGIIFQFRHSFFNLLGPIRPE